MIDYEQNPYYYPENSDLEIVGIVNWTNELYEFDMTVVWRDSTGMFYWDSDSGCSCPLPFEDAALNNVGRGSAFDAVTYLEDKVLALEKAAEGSSWYKEQLDYGMPQVVDLISKIMR